MIIQVIDFGMLRVAPEARPTIRNSFVLGMAADGVTSIEVTFPRDIQPNYFAMVIGTPYLAPSSATASVNCVGWRVTADPFGTGALAVVGHARKLRLERNTGTDDSVVLVRLFECTSDPDGNGFRLLGVESIAAPVTALAGDQHYRHTCVDSTAWSNQVNTVIYAGRRGGGATSAGATSNDAPTILHHCHVIGANQIALQKRGYSISDLGVTSYGQRKRVVTNYLGGAGAGSGIAR